MDMLIRKNWKILAEDFAPGSLAERVLIARGFREPSERVRFLDLSLDLTHDPYLMPGMDRAVSRIHQAILAKEQILVHGDYDVDGLTATALLALLLRDMGAQVKPLIPDRMADGYGISVPGVMKAISEGTTLLVTVDCGVSAKEEIDSLTRLGIDTIVTDHHACPASLPDAIAILNPHLPDSGYPFPELCGAGVAYKLAQALCSRMGADGREQAFLDLAAIGTIADVVPLYGENRIIAAHGLDAIRARPRTGIRALIEASGLSGKPVTAFTIGYSIAPRMNAAGRMGDANRALQLLMTDESNAASALAEELVAVNKDRQAIEAAIFKEAVERVDKQPFADREPIVVAGEGWHSGVIGIVAARLAEQYQLPAVVLAGEDGVFKGSGRTCGSFDLLAAIEAASSHTIRYGGHRKAAGLSVAAEQLEDFRQALIHYGRDRVDPAQMGPSLTADLEVAPEDLTLASARDLEKLMPFGEENPKPLFILKEVRILDMRLVGNGRHVRFRFRIDRAGLPGTLFEGIGFGLGEVDEEYVAGDLVDLLFHLEINRYNGQEQVSLQVRDLRPSGHGLALPGPSEDKKVRVPTLSDFRIAWQYLASRFEQRPVLADLSVLGRRISRSYQADMDENLLAPILKVLSDAGLMRYYAYGDERVRFQLLPPGQGRVRLQDIPSYRQLMANGETGL